MNRFRTSTGMPIKLWIWSLIAAVFLVFSIQGILLYRTKYMLGVNGKIKDIGNYNSDKDEILDIQFIGSSLTNNAIKKFDNFDRLIDQRKSNLKYKFTRMGSSQLDDFNEKIEEIKAQRPSCLFIESDLVSLNKKSNMRGRIVVLPQSIINILKKKSTKNDKVNSSDFLQNNTQIDYANGIVFEVRKVDEFPEWSAFFKEAKSLGIKVCFLDLPRSKEAEQFLPKHIKEGYKLLLQEYESKYGIEYLDFPYELSRDKYYIDRAHFNKIGSKFYCEWLWSNLNNIKN